jgi:hypothetical protein
MAQGRQARTRGSSRSFGAITAVITSSLIAARASDEADPLTLIQRLDQFRGSGAVTAPEFDVRKSSGRC